MTQLLTVNHTSFCLPTNSDVEGRGLFLDHFFSTETGPRLW